MDPQLGSYSELDTQSPVAAYNNPDNPTMNLRIDETTPDDEIPRTCMHELLHAIGVDHEHQSPAANIEWDEDAVYEEMAKSGWTREKTQQAQRAALKIRPQFNHDVPDPREPDKERVFQHSQHHAF